jgi:hypothetical protein
MRSLQLRLAPTHVVRAVTVYSTASARTAELSAVAGRRELTVSEADYLEHAQDMLAGARATLAEAGRLDLVEVAS